MSLLEVVIAALRSSPAFYIATVGAGRKPHVRPFNLVMEYNGHLAFSTSSAKKVYGQLRKRPYVEISVFDAERGAWWRLHGKVHWTNDRAAKKKVFEVMPELAAQYQGPENPQLKVFWIEGAADCYVLGPEPHSNPARTIALS